MPHISAFSDFDIDSSAPQWLCIRFDDREINWEDPYVYIYIGAPYETYDDTFDDYSAIAIHLEELTVRIDKPDHIGIYLPAVRSRLPEDSSINRFILRLSDIEEALQLSANRSY